MITRESIEFGPPKCFAFSDHHHIVRRCDDLGLQSETIAPKRRDGSFGKATTIFFIDGVDREFKNLDDLIDVYNEKFTFESENPEYEIIWVKIVRKRDLNLSAYED